MARKPAPTKNTSGSGFSFEDNVTSYLLAYLLAGEAPFDTEWGNIVRLDFQTRVHGWYLDDILITFSTGTRLALSLKSNAQVTVNRLPDDFVSDVWEQYLQHISVAFQIASDYLGLVTSPRAPKTDEALHELVRWAKDQDEEHFLARVKATGVSSAVKRNLFASLGCPSTLATQYGASEKDAVRLLRRLRFLSYDFQSEPSKDLASAKRLCRSILKSSDLAEADEIWNKLLAVASQCRQSGGYLDLPKIVGLVQANHALKLWPQFVSDFEAIAEWTREALESLPDTIGLKVRLPRTAEVKKLAEGSANNKFMALTGPSGCGKSVIVKNWIGTLVDVPVLWMDGKTLAQGKQNSELQRDLGLNHSLEKVAASTPLAQALCIVDGAGSITSSEGYQSVARLIRALSIEDESSPWRLVLVCQQEEWNRVLTEVSRTLGRLIPWTKLSVEGLGGTGSGAEELNEVWRSFPLLQPLILQPELQSLLLRPKILDLIATRYDLGTGINTAGWIGESSIACWYWTTEIERPPAEVTRSQVVRQLAEQQAEPLSPQTVASTATNTVNDLVNERVLKFTGGRLSFEHDLLGDWSRLQVLIEKRSSLTAFVQSKIISPFWNRAVRLYGLYLLEQGDPAQWKETLDAFAISESRGSLSQDLILEAVVFAANPARLLEDLWPFLREDGGKLLRRLLGRFLYTATEPNPHRLALAKTPTDELRQSTEDRMPYWPYWLPMLNFLQLHKAEAILLAPLQVAEISDKWLRFAPVNWIGRQEAASLSLAIATDVLAHEWDYGYATGETAELAYSAVLAAGHEQPDETRDFVLRASGRIKRPARKLNDDPDMQPAVRLTTPPGMVKRRPSPKPWLDGPVQEPNDEFQKVCFNTPAVFSLIDSEPALAGEILLALLINLPREYDFGDEIIGGFRDMECEISESSRYHYPPFYWNYPWLYFLRRKPQEAINTIVRLVNFATERRIEVIQRRNGFSPSVEFHTADVKVVWNGDSQTYFWYTSIHGPHPVSSVLMALEFWLYEQIDKGESVSPYIEQIVSSSRSVAFAGLLAVVACKHRTLLNGPLQFLMSVPEFLSLERQKSINILSQTAMIAWAGKHTIDIQYAREWYEMPHRTENLESVAHGLMLTNSVTRVYFKNVCEVWRKKLNDIRQHDPEDADALERLISAFTPEDHTFEYSEDQGSILVTHTLPKALEESARPIRERAEAGLLRSTFPSQCQRLLDREITLNTDEETQIFWEKCQKIVAMPDDEDRMLRREDCACGAAAVLLLHHEDWLSQHPDRAIWCHEQIISTIENPPKPIGFDTEVDAAEWHWHSFCSAAIPSLWVREIDSKRLRKCVALMALDHHYRTVGSLFRACHNERRKLGGQFFKLQALIRYWAIERIPLRRREDALSGGFVLRSQERRSFREIMSLGEELWLQMLSAEFLQVVSDFIDDTLPVDLPSLVSNANSQAVLDFNRLNPHERRRNRYLVEVELIQWAYSYLPALNLAEDEQERKQWITLWQEILTCLLQTLRPAIEEDQNKEVAGTPYETDRWILQRISVLLPQMRGTEEPDMFWKPILDLGWQAHSWVESFLSGFFTYNLLQATDTAQRGKFIWLWSEMIDYANKSPLWNYSPDTRGWHIGENWESLMGLQWSFAYQWDENQQALLSEMQDKLKLFCDRHLHGYRTMEKFLRLLRNPAAQKIRVPALLWIGIHFLPDSSDHQSDADHSLGLLLAECWQINQEELKRVPEVFDCFIRLVKYLADRQSAIALEIQSRIIAG